MRQSKVAGVGAPRRKGSEQPVHKNLLLSEAGKNGEGNILGEARLSPPLNSHAADETKWPALLLTKSLDFFGCRQHPGKVNHAPRLLWKIACCSTSPDQSGRSRQPSTAARFWMICRARSSVIAASSCALNVSTASHRALYSARNFSLNSCGVASTDTA